MCIIRERLAEIVLMPQNKCFVHNFINHQIENDLELYDFIIKILLLRFALWDTATILNIKFNVL